MNIGSGNTYPSNALSNFAPHSSTSYKDTPISINGDELYPMPFTHIICYNY